MASPFAMTTKANAMPKRLRFGMTEPTSHALANDKFSLTTNHQPLPTVYFRLEQYEFVKLSSNWQESSRVHGHKR